MSAVKADLAKIALTQPVCTEVGEKIALSRRVEKHWRYVEQRECPPGCTLNPALVWILVCFECSNCRREVSVPVEPLLPSQ